MNKGACVCPGMLRLAVAKLWREEKKNIACIISFVSTSPRDGQGLLRSVHLFFGLAEEYFSFQTGRRGRKNSWRDLFGTRACFWLWSDYCCSARLVWREPSRSCRLRKRKRRRRAPVRAPSISTLCSTSKTFTVWCHSEWVTGSPSFSWPVLLNVGATVRHTAPNCRPVLIGRYQSKHRRVNDCRSVVLNHSINSLVDIIGATVQPSASVRTSASLVRSAHALTQNAEPCVVRACWVGKKSIDHLEGRGGGDFYCSFARHTRFLCCVCVFVP